MAPRPQNESEGTRCALNNGIKKTPISKNSKSKGEMSLKKIHLLKAEERLNLKMAALAKAAKSANLKVSQILMNTLMNKKKSVCSFVSKYFK